MPIRLFQSTGQSYSSGVVDSIWKNIGGIGQILRMYNTFSLDFPLQNEQTLVQ